jgi:hypothetical protein
MSMLDSSTVGAKQQPSSRLWIRATLGLCILSAIIFWVAREGSLLQQLNVWAIAISILIFFVTNVVNASMLQLLVRIYGREMSFRLALQIGTLGSLGNATGGLPIGTTVKYAILNKHVGLTIAQITFGLIAVAAGIALALLAFAAISIFALDYPPAIKLAPIVLLIGGVGALVVVVRFLYRRGRFAGLLDPLIVGRNARTLLLFSVSMATLSVLNYLVVGWFVLPTYSAMAIVFISASGMLVGLASLLQSIAGLQELIMGLTALATGTHAVDGVQLALVIRLTSVISSGLTLGGSYLFLNPRRRSTN